MTVHICLDIDDTITYSPRFFRTLVELMPSAAVTVVSFRTDRQKALATLRECGVRFDHLILSNDEERGRSADQSLEEWKAELVNDLDPDWFFEDMPEVVARIRPGITVFMPCDPLIREWLGQASDRGSPLD